MPRCRVERASRRAPALAAALALLLAALAALLAAAPAHAEKRVALVIGNAAYKHAPALANPKNDAEGVAASLKRLKFEVLEGVDLDKPAMERLLQAFSLKLETADVALVFYAGHGLQVQGRNYLVPVEAKLDREADLVFQAVPLDVIQGLMEAQQRTNIMILDACRDNPLARNLARNMGTRSTSIGRGLGEAKAGIGTLIVYATQPGNVALDGETGANSPFTAALLAHLETKGLEVRQVLTRVRQAVIEKTRGKQVPWDSSSLAGDFFFVAASRETPPAETKPPTVTLPSTETPRGPSADSEVVFWQSIQNSKNAADYKAYLEKYPTGTFAALAKIRLAEIEKAAVVTPPAPAPLKPADPEKPAPSPAPEVPKRMSTFEVGTYISNGDNLWDAGGLTTTARDCQVRCLRNLECRWWTWSHDNAQVPRICQLRRGALNPHRMKDDMRTSGVIRTTPAAAPAQPNAPKPQPGATPAPGDQQTTMRELIRKAEKREAENGFCARAKFSNQDYWVGPTTTRALRTSGTGTSLSNDACGVWRADGEANIGGFTVRSVTTWSCRKGGHCGTSRWAECRTNARANSGYVEWSVFLGADNPNSIQTCLR